MCYHPARMGSPVQRIDPLARRVETILDQLMLTPAGELESERLEFKSWCNDERDLSREIGDAAVCLASTEGGLLVLGVDDKAVGSRAFARCPHKGVTVEWVRAKVRELTKPPVRCHVHKVSELLPALLGEPQGDLIVVELPKTTHISGHRNSKGVSLKRYDKSCKPEYFEDQDDFSRSLVEHLDVSALDEASMSEGAKNRESETSLGERLGHWPADHLFEAGLIGPPVQTATSGAQSVTVAAVLMFGKEGVIRSEFPSAETELVEESSVTRTASSSSWTNIVTGLPYFISRITQLLKAPDSDIPEGILRELLVNAFVHRCYRTHSPIQIKIRPGEVEIVNPGGLLGGLTSETLLYSPPTYRNFLLADAARQFGYCERIGSGIDKVYYLSLMAGFDFPILQVGSNSFSALVRTNRDRAFESFIKNYAGGLSIKLNELIVLRGLRGKPSRSVDELCRLAQRTPEHISVLLSGLETRHIIEGDERGYRLSRQTLDTIAQYDENGQMKLFN
jgi:ATP-dependent DNA helicase RecG